MEVRVLGPLTLDDGRIPLTRRDRAVLAALTVCLGDAVSVESLADAVWGADLPASWSKVVPGCIMRLRRLISPATIETVDGGYRLLSDHVEVDAERFERLMNRGMQRLEAGDAYRAAHALSEAAALWRGDPYPELTDWVPARIEADRLQELRLGVEDLLLDARLQGGETEQVAALARSRVAEAPLRERRWVILSLALYRQGRQADALATVRKARGLLNSELGLDPGVELAALEQAILRQDPSLLADHVFRVASPECPYFGLPPAGAEDADRYYGREHELSSAVDTLEQHGLLLVTGSSGVGKSSFVRAGIGAHFTAIGRPVTVVTPGRHPLEALRNLELANAGSVVIVDQCEEAFAAESAAEVREFFADLSAMVFAATLVVCIRADCLGRLAEHAGFAEIIESHLLVLAPLRPDALREVIERPAEQAGLILEPGLAEVLIRDADGRNLPLLSHALRQVWLRREGRVMTVDGYRASGEIEGAVAKTAEGVYSGLSSDEARSLRDILLRLVEAMPDGTIICRRVERALVAVDLAHERIVDRLVDARLLVSDEVSVQVSHEALAREWPRLREWLADDVEGQRIMRHLGSTATSWDELGRPVSELYRGPRLTAAEQWRRTANPSLTAVEQSFLEASRTQEDADLESAHAQLRRERRMRRRLVWVSAGAAGLAVATIAVGTIAGMQASVANEAAVVTTARRVAAVAMEEQSLDRALLLALQAVDLWDDPETRVRLMDVIARAPRATGVTHVPSANVATVDALGRVRADAVYSADGRFVAVPAPPRLPDADWTTIELRTTGASDRADPVTLDLPLSGRAPTSAPLGRIVVMFSPDGSRLYASGFGPTTIFDTATGAELAVLPGSGLLAVSADGRRVAIRGDGPRAHIIELDGATAPVMIRLTAPPVLAQFSPDGTRLAVADTSADISLIDTGTGGVTEILGEHDDIVTAIDFSSAEELVTTGGDGEVITWDLGDWSASFRDTEYRVSGTSGEHTERALQLVHPDGTVQVVVADAAGWREQACRVAGRPLTEHEWQEFIGSTPYAPTCNP